MSTFTISEDLLKGWKAMVVDDEADSLEVAQILLTLCGADVIVATNGQDGLEKAIENRPRFIISDLSMPGMSGWQMLHELKKNLATRDIPVIALTAHAMKGDRELAFGAGFHNYLTKPLRPETFVNDLLNLLIDIPSIAQDLVPDVSESEALAQVASLFPVPGPMNGREGKDDHQTRPYESGLAPQ